MGKAKTGGILVLIGGIIDLVLGLLALMVVIWATALLSGSGYEELLLAAYVNVGLAIVGAAIGIVGGVFAMKQKKFMFAIIGAICVIIGGWGAYYIGLILGLIGLIFIIMGKSDFNGKPKGYPAQPGYPPQGYPPQPGYPPQGYPPQPGYPPQQPPGQYPPPQY